VTVSACPHGNGVFATRPFKEGETISSFQAPFVKEIDPSRSWAVLRVGDLYWSEPTSGEGVWSNFLDHSDQPNARFVNFDFEAGTGDLVTLKPIEMGEEILINYGEYSPENIADIAEDLPPTALSIPQDEFDKEVEGIENEVTKLEQEAQTFI